MANEPPKRIYYKARDDLQLNHLPFFFGWVDVEGKRVVGEHYKPKTYRFHFWRSLPARSR